MKKLYLATSYDIIKLEINIFNEGRFKHMKNRKWKIIAIFLIVVLIVFLIVDYFLVSPVYLYISNVDNSSTITIDVNDGQGHYKYKRYKLTELEKGIYQLQAYGSLISGKTYPITITIDNKDGHIKEIKQKDIEGNLKTIIKKE